MPLNKETKPHLSPEKVLTVGVLDLSSEPDTGCHQAVKRDAKKDLERFLTKARCSRW